MRVCVPMTPGGEVDPRWGRADRVAIADVVDGEVRAWEQHDVGWGAAHDTGTEGAHHARIASFLREHGVEAVAVDHVGAEMQRCLPFDAMLRMAARVCRRRSAAVSSRRLGCRRRRASRLAAACEQADGCAAAAPAPELAPRGCL